MSKSIKHCIGHSAGEFNPSSIEVPVDKVALRIIDIGSERKVGEIIVQESAELNNRVGRYEVIAVGEEASEEYGLQVGDYVMADRLAVYYDTGPICVMDYNNVIYKVDENGAHPEPLKGMVFTEEIKKDDIYKEGGLFIASRTNHVPIGLITKMNIDEVKYPDINIGDQIIMTDGADICIISNKKIRIYKPYMIIAKVED